jgi:DNA helicase-2/ATP-dependent DNA helicase PcrA
MSNEKLECAWSELSEVQRQAAAWGDGALLVLAGPGSGKTRVLTCRIARILESTRKENFRILGLTFTNMAADEIRTRVASFVPGEEYRLFLGTFHSFCADVLRQHGIHMGINPNFRIYSHENDLQAVLDDAVREAQKHSGLVTELDRKTLPVIQRLKSNLISPEESRQVFRDEQFGKRIAAVYPAYEAELLKRNALDFNSLIFKAHQLLIEFPAFAKRYRSVYRYISVDEFQDSNLAQYRLIKALTGNDYRNIFIVADDDQIIYQWNGASHKRIENFVDDYSPEVIQLPTNYRCPPEVIRLANNLISHNFTRATHKKPLQSSKTIRNENVVRLLPEFPDFESEARGVAADIKTLHGRRLDSVVILARNRKLIESAARALKHEMIPAVISQRKDEFSSTPFVWLHSVLRLASNKNDRISLEALCGAFEQLTNSKIDPDEVLTQSESSDLGFLQHWLLCLKEKPLEPLSKRGLEEVHRLVTGQQDYLTFSSNAIKWFQSIEAMKRTDSASDQDVFSGYEEELAVWRSLVQEISISLGEHASLEAFLQELQMHSKESSLKPNTVALMSIHAAKGKEFEHLYLIGLVEDELPSFQSLKKGDRSFEMEEERRSCFVAITRAIKSLTLSYSAEYRGWRKKPSRFLYEMGLLKEAA